MFNREKLGTRGIFFLTQAQKPDTMYIQTIEKGWKWPRTIKSYLRSYYARCVNLGKAMRLEGYKPWMMCVDVVICTAIGFTLYHLFVWNKNAHKGQKVLDFWSKIWDNIYIENEGRPFFSVQNKLSLKGQTQWSVS